MSAFAALADWGTSSFRLWLVDGEGAVLGERRSSEGMTTAGEAEGGFAGVLERQLDALGVAGDLPVVACGMVGARQGWVEATYIDTPADPESLADGAVRVTDTGRAVFILPGVCQRAEGAFDVMRGEETQILGLEAGEGRRLACLPGTHSKWVVLEEDRLTGFSTFMTGDLYAAIAGHTILKHSVKPQDESFDVAVFQAAVRAAFARPAELSNRLFSIRAAGLLAQEEAQHPATTLSGLLIGLELAGAASRFGRLDETSVRLVAAGPLASRYRAAFDALDIAAHEEDGEAAVRRGLLAAARKILR
ncbi:2-dehydro-3-deoxygalactonokinase [Aurantimonas sp. 22II-16-19i]|uniref:2-dehydro-3-deoxygalactonokinase n=1 Tax=Aurantimonas sp. 22II-16-19i TaxID=1317114 RepID=UPI0009F7EBCB|nr:2-dehydro-3-deoxygalactonokinase [Aurantimonas sp. 22II-16-19i]ORE97319.1 2-dehydro-3-deoxygalactonate kinase [Aurantimonas sp. 22II-16-19i]